MKQQNISPSYLYLCNSTVSMILERIGFCLKKRKHMHMLQYLADIFIGLDYLISINGPIFLKLIFVNVI